MMMTPEARAEFAEIVGPPSPNAEPEPDDAPAGPRAPRVDLSQGSSGRPSYVDAAAEARDRFAEALRQGARSGQGAWTPVE